MGAFLTGVVCSGLPTRPQGAAARATVAREVLCPFGRIKDTAAPRANPNNFFPGKRHPSLDDRPRPGGG